MQKRPFGRNARCTLVETPFGEGGIIHADKPLRVLACLLPRPDVKDFPPEVLTLARTLRPPKALERLVQAFARYFLGKPPVFDLPLLDFSPLSELERAVLYQTMKIPWGQTISYGQLALAVGRPKAARFVGATMAKNPFPVFVPCHRVVRSDGSLGGFGGGLALKRRMLALEQD
ncbi:MAG: methylated-DNA--[protein]-cysteine S-methyltransferase [Desulfatibacillaceae bacterium]|nr:methylated-DNA--[protein]-cysteine S-methyltransferase [Desulfatibacillaceae bacterium]